MYKTLKGKEVKFGDTLTFEKEGKTPYGMGKTILTVTLTKDNVEILIKEGFLVETEKEFKLGNIHEQLRKKLEMDKAQFVKFIEDLHEISPTAYKALLLEVLSDIAFDMEREDKPTEYWYVEPTELKVRPLKALEFSVFEGDAIVFPDDKTALKARTIVKTAFYE